MPSPPGRSPHDDTRDDHGQTALHLAAHAGQAGTVRRLAAAGTEVDARDADGNPPLHRAVQSGHFEAAQILIAAGADVNAPTGFGHRPLHLATGAKHEKLAELLVAHGADVEAPIAGGRRSRPLHLAAEAGLPRLAALLLRRGADKNATNADGQTLLDLAEGDGLPAGVLHEGHAAVAALLRQRGASRGRSDEPESPSSSPRGFRGRMSHGPGRNGRIDGR
jgi:ankyrin repeat protein